MAKIRAELWDKMHYLFRGYNDRMVHQSLTYNYRIDIDAVKYITRKMLNQIPILHSSFESHIINPYWFERDFDVEEVVSVINLSSKDELNMAEEEFLMWHIPPENHVQLYIRIFFYSENTDGKNIEKSTICFLTNHMVMDGGDFKTFLKHFCESYTEYVMSGVKPELTKTGSRAYHEVYSDLSHEDKKKAKLLYKNVSSSGKHKFPFEKPSKSDKSFLVKHKLEKDKFSALRIAGKKVDATVNDILVGTFLHTLYEEAGYPDSDKIVVSCAIDLRRHMRNTTHLGYTNHTAFMPCYTEYKGADILESILLAKESATRSKSDKFLGLYGLPLLKLAYTIFPYFISEIAIRIGYSNPYISISNIGLLDEQSLSLCGNLPIDGFMTGSVKYKPFSLMSASSLNGELTMAMCERGSEKDRQTVKRFMNRMEEHFDEFIRLCK